MGDPVYYILGYAIITTMALALMQRNHELYTDALQMAHQEAQKMLLKEIARLEMECADLEDDLAEAKKDGR